MYSYQEHILSQERILDQKCVLNHLEINERFFLFDHSNPPPLNIPPTSL